MKPFVTTATSCEKLALHATSAQARLPAAVYTLVPAVELMFAVRLTAYK